MNRFQNKNYRGFTIIEVSLVVAVVGLIFAMIFIALPTLQRSWRSEKRRQDISLIQLGIENYRNANGGESPWDKISGIGSPTYMPQDQVQNFINEYVKKGDFAFKDPLSGEDYEITMAKYLKLEGAVSIGSQKPNQIGIYGNAYCPRDHHKLPHANFSGLYAIVYGNEAGGSGESQCITYGE